MPEPDSDAALQCGNIDVHGLTHARNSKNGPGEVAGAGASG